MIVSRLDYGLEGCHATFYQVQSEGYHYLQTPQVPSDLERAAERYKERLLQGECRADIPVEIESSCQKISGEEVQEIVQTETKHHLINLYKVGICSNISVIPKNESDEINT